jgi:xanthine dehydrogenase accessory factor
LTSASAISIPPAFAPTLFRFRRGWCTRQLYGRGGGDGGRPQDFVLIATNNQDREALDRLITQPVAWLGLLASRRKVQAFVRQMRENGVTEADISRLRAPIGYDIGAETPNEIAISVLAEILQVKNGAPGG